MEGRIEINRGGVNNIGQSGIGYIVVPDDTVREQYIANCYRTSTVTMSGGYGYGYICNVRILPDVLQQIHFPLTQDERGTIVFWVRENFSNTPVIVGVIADNEATNLLVENQDRWVQEVDGKYVEIFQDANTALLNINVTGLEETPARINIKVSSGSTDSEVNIISDGSVNVDAENISVTLRDTLELNLKDEEDNELITVTGKDGELLVKDQYENSITMNEQNVNITVANQLNVNTGSEPMVLGNTLVSILDELCTAIEQITVITPVGSSSVPVNIASFTSIQSKLRTILSGIANLD